MGELLTVSKDKTFDRCNSRYFHGYKVFECHRFWVIGYVVVEYLRKQG